METNDVGTAGFAQGILETLAVVDGRFHLIADFDTGIGGFKTGENLTHDRLGLPKAIVGNSNGFGSFFSRFLG